MKLLKIAATILGLCGVIFLASSCALSSASASSVKTQLATAQRGNLSVAVTGTGNLALSRSEDMAFEIAGYVQEVMVKESQSVKEGDVLAKLDTSDWDKKLKTLEKALVTAERSLITREDKLTEAERQVTAKELAVRQAQLDVQTAEYNLTKIEEVREVQDKIDDIEYRIKFAQSMLDGSAKSAIPGVDPAYWSQHIAYLKQDLAAAHKEMKEILDGTSVAVTNDVLLQVAKYKFQVEQSQRQLDNAQLAVEDAGKAVNSARLDVKEAEQAVKDAQSDLDEAKSKSPIIKAPFAGFITKINVKGGDEVFKGTIAMQIADPNQFEANIMVTEKDVFSVKVDGDATVSIDALSGVSFPAKITAIAPLATTSQGVVSYKVTVKITSLQPSATSTNASAQKTTTGASNITQNITLKSGLTATVTIVTQKKDNVLVVPNRAITRQGQTYVVQVAKGTSTETRNVKTGMADSKNTEITEGLSEGEQVVIATSTGTASTSNNRTKSVPVGIPGISAPPPEVPPPGGF